MTELQQPPMPVDSLERVTPLARGSLPLLLELADLFRDEQAPLFADLAAAVEAGDATRLRLAAHALHGTAAHFGHRPTCAAARTLALMGRSGNLMGAREAFAALTEAVGRLEQALQHLTAEPHP